MATLKQLLQFLHRFFRHIPLLEGLSTGEAVVVVIFYGDMEQPPLLVVAITRSTKYGKET